MLAEERRDICEKALQEYLTSGKSMRDLGTNYQGITRGFLGGYFLAKGIDIYSRKSHVNDHIFDVIDTEEKAYWLGFLYADGNVHKHNKSWHIELTLQERDFEHLRKYAAFIGFMREPKYRKNTKAYRISTGSRRMAEQLIEKGCVPKKSLILTFPSHDIVPENLMRHFIRGYFDGDGCICLRNNVHSVVPCVSVIGTKEFLEGLLNEYGGNEVQTIKKDKRSPSNTYEVLFHKDEGLRFLSYMYDTSSIYLQRKFDKYNINTENNGDYSSSPRS